MQFAQFYHPSTGWNGRDFTGPVKLIPVCGTEGVLPFDGRWSLTRCVNHAREVCKKRGYNGFTINVGSTYLNERAIRSLEVVKPL